MYTGGSRLKFLPRLSRAEICPCNNMTALKHPKTKSPILLLFHRLFASFFLSFFLYSYFSSFFLLFLSSFSHFPFLLIFSLFLAVFPHPLLSSPVLAYFPPFLHTPFSSWIISLTFIISFLSFFLSSWSWFPFYLSFFLPLCLVYFFTWLLLHRLLWPLVFLSVVDELSGPNCFRSVGTW